MVTYVVQILMNFQKNSMEENFEGNLKTYHTAFMKITEKLITFDFYSEQDAR